MAIKVQFVERKPSEFVSIENVFRQVAAHLPADRYQTSFQQVPFRNDLISIIKNLIFFRPEKADIYHITGHVHYMAFRLPAAKTVLTIHDLGFLHSRKGVRRYLLKKILLDWPLRRLKYVTTVSEFTRDEILDHLPSHADKIRVVENPLGAHLKVEFDKPFDQDRPTILQVGTMKNKNVSRLIEAVQGIACKLRIIGPLDAELEGTLKRSRVEIENVADLDDAAMAREYQNSDIVAFCSTYEGFGLPIIEAQAMKKLVLTSDRSPMREVAGEVAVLVDPEDVDSIRTGLLRIIDDDKLRKSLIANGVENIKRFSAENVADKYSEVYDSISRL